MNKLRLQIFGGKVTEFTLGDLASDASLESSQHPNKMPVKGTLVLLDRPSNQAPHGSDGHRIMMTTAGAQRNLKGLIGMGLNYSTDLESHAPRRKVGVITEASIQDGAIKIKGMVWKKDFPEAEDVLKGRGDLGMSMELSDVSVEDIEAQVWVLDDFKFTGATILKKDAAAYHRTSLAASTCHQITLAASRAVLGKQENNDMPTSDKKKVKGELATLVAAAVQGVANPLLEEIRAGRETNKQILSALVGLNKTQKTITDQFTELAASREVEAEADELAEFEELLASGDENASGDDSEEDDIEAAKDKKDKEDAEDDPSDASEEEMDADASEVTAGGDEMDDMNKDAGKNTKGGGGIKGGKVSASKGKIDDRTKKVLHAAATKVGNLSAQLAKSLKTQKAQQNQITALSAQVSLYASRVDRRSVTPEVAHLLEKGGHSVSDLFASGTKLTTAQVDEMFASSGLPLDVKTRMAFKNQLLQNGLMEMGVITRHHTN